MKKLLTLTAIAAITAPVAAFALSDTELLGKATVSLTDAVATAEKNQGGKAIEVDLTEHKDSPVWEVKVLLNEKEYDVKVDGVSGAVLEAKRD